MKPYWPGIGSVCIARPRSLATAWHLCKLKRPLDGPDETLVRPARARLGRLLHPPQGGDLLAPARPLAAHFHRASPAAASAKGTLDRSSFPSFDGITSESQRTGAQPWVCTGTCPNRRATEHRTACGSSDASPTVLAAGLSSSLSFCLSMGGRRS